MTGYVQVPHPDTDEFTAMPPLPVKDMATPYGIVHSVDLTQIQDSREHCVTTQISSDLSIHWAFHRDEDGDVIHRTDKIGNPLFFVDSVITSHQKPVSEQPIFNQALLNGIPQHNFIWAYHYHFKSEGKYLAILFICNPKSQMDEDSHHHQTEFRWIVTDKPLE